MTQMTPPRRFENLAKYAGELGYPGISLEFCQEMNDLMAPETDAILYPPIVVVREFREFMDGMRELLGPPR